MAVFVNVQLSLEPFNSLLRRGQFVVANYLGELSLSSFSEFCVFLSNLVIEFDRLLCRGVSPSRRGLSIMDRLSVLGGATWRLGSIRTGLRVSNFLSYRDDIERPYDLAPVWEVPFPSGRGVRVISDVEAPVAPTWVSDGAWSVLGNQVVVATAES